MKTNIVDNANLHDEYISSKDFPKRAQEKELPPWNIYPVKKDFLIDGIPWSIGQKWQFIGISDNDSNKIALTNQQDIIYVDKQQFEEYFPESSISTKDLSHIALSSMYPLISRIAASKNSQLSNFKDKWSAKIFDVLHQNNDYDFDMVKYKIDEVSTASRTEIFDDVINGFLNKHADWIIVNIWGGLNPNIGPKMFDKNDPKKDITIFYNIDVPEINAIQKKVFKQSSHNVFIGKSVFDTFWMKEVPKDKPILFVSEWVFMYFPLEEIKKLFHSISYNYPNSEMAFETSSFLVKSLSKFSPILRKTKTPFKMWIKDSKSVETRDVNGKIKLLHEYRFMDKYPDQWWALGSLAKIPGLWKTIKNMKKIIHISFDSDEKSSE